MRHLIILAVAPPCSFSGHAIALKTSTEVLAPHCESISYICALDSNLQPEISGDGGNFEFINLGIRRRSIVERFLRSFGNCWPALCQQYVTRAARSSLAKALQMQRRKFGEESAVLVENLPVMALIDSQQSEKWKNILYLRSHDVLCDAFQLFTREGGWFNKMAWKKELRAIRAFEGGIARSCAGFYAITKQDAGRYMEEYRIRSDGVLGVKIDSDRYRMVPPGDHCTAIHIGGADTRRSQGLDKLVNEVWPKVKLQIPAAKLILAGSGSKRYSRPELGILGIGVVDDDREFLARGRIFINPQEAGSGVKLKSLIAMASGKVLVTTRNGVSGLNVEDGVHCRIATDAATMVNVLCHVIRDRETSDLMPALAMEYVQVEFGKRAVEDQYKELLTQIARKSQQIA